MALPIATDGQQVLRQLVKDVDRLKRAAGSSVLYSTDGQTGAANETIYLAQVDPTEDDLTFTNDVVMDETVSAGGTVSGDGEATLTPEELWVVVPSTPICSTNQQAVSVTWDGAGAGGEKVGIGNFGLVEVHRSLNEFFNVVDDEDEATPSEVTLVGVLTYPGTIVFTNQMYDVPYYYRFVLVTADRRRSGQSDTAVGVASMIALGDIDDEAIGQIQQETLDDAAAYADTAANREAAEAQIAADLAAKAGDTATLDTANANAQTMANAAKTAANAYTDTVVVSGSGNKITMSASNPSGTPKVGDLWFKTLNGEIIGQWVGITGTPNTWSPQTMNGAVLTNLNAGTITTGTLAAGRIAAGSLTISQTGGLQTALDTKVTSFVTAGVIPTSVTVGDLWVNTSDGNKVYRAAMVGANEIKAGEWVLQTNVVTFAQPGIPTSLNAGDLWFDTDDGNKTYRAEAAGATTIGLAGSGKWVEYQDQDLVALAARGNNWVINGDGVLKNNTNFSPFTFHGEDAPTGTSGSFWVTSGVATSYLTDEFISVNPTIPMRMSFKARQTTPGAVSKMYGLLMPYDSAGSVISNVHYMYIAGTITTLAQDLKPGDTTVYLTSAANWYGSAAKPAGAATYNRNLQFWDYTDPSGKAWPVGSYTRNVLTADLYADGAVDTTANTITLRAAYSGSLKPAGTSLSQPTSGSAYLYMPSASNVTVPETWTDYADTFSAGVFPAASQAVTSTGSAAWTTGLPSATAKVRVGWLLNYAPTSGRHAVTAVVLSDVAAASASAAASAQTINGWTKTGSTNIDGGAIAADTITAVQIAAAQISTSELIVGDLSNMVEINEAFSIGTMIGGAVGLTHTIVNGWSGRSSDASTNFLLRNQKGPLPFKTGDRMKVVFEAYLASGATVNGSVYLGLYGNTNVGQNIGSSYNVTTTPTVFTVEGDVTADTTLKTSYLLTLSGFANRTLYVRNARAYLMNAGELIVDGAVRANHVATGTLTVAHTAGLQAALDSKTTAFAQPGIPTSKAIGDLWVDTDDGNKRYVAAAAGATTIGTGGWVLDVPNVTFVQAAPAPVSVNVGDVWVNTSENNRIYKATTAGVSNAWVAQPAVAGKTVFAQTAPPTSLAAGDIWYDTDDGNKQYVAYAAGVSTVGATGWVLTPITPSTMSFTQPGIPTALNKGDLWIDTDDGNRAYYATAAGVNTINETTGWALATPAELTATKATVDGWKYLGGTYIDGGDIQTDTVTAAQIAANSIRAKQLVLSDTSNMAEINEATAVGTIFDTTHVITSGWSTRASSTSTYFMFRDKQGPVPIKTGDRIRMVFEAYADAPVTATGRLWAYGTPDAPSLALSPTFALTTTATLFSAEGTVTADMSNKVTYMVGLDGLAGRNVFVRNARVYRMDAAELIVDGAISTRHLAADSITAAQIQAGAVSAEKIALGVLRRNLVFDGSFEETYALTDWDPFNAAGQGNRAQWRDMVPGSTAGVLPVRDATGQRARSGNKSMLLTCATGQTNGVVSNTFPVTPGKVHRLVVNACSLTALASMVVDVQVGLTDGNISGFDPVTLTGDSGWILSPPLATVPVDAAEFSTYSWTFTPAAGQNFAAVRIINNAATAACTLVLDDISVVETDTGGASELTAAGLRLFNNAGMEVTALVSNRSNYFSVAGQSNDTLASIDSAGGGSFQTVDVGGVSALIGVYAYQLTSNVATIWTRRPHGYDVGDPVFVAGVTATFNGAYTVVDAISPVAFTYAKTAANVAYTLATEGATVNVGATLATGDRTTGLTIYGTEFLDWLEQFPKGHVALSYRIDTSGYNTVEQPYIQLDAAMTRGRLYRITSKGVVANNTAGARSIVNLAYTTNGTPATPTSGTLQYWRTQSITAGLSSHFMMEHYYAPSSDIDFSTCLSVYPEGGGSSRFSGGPTDPVYVNIEDMGIYRGDTGIDRSAANPTPPPTLKTYTTTWTSTSAKSYMGTSGLPADSSQGTQDMKQGYSSYDGDSRSLWIFPSSMVTTLGGVVSDTNIIKVRIYLYANHWYNSTGGTALLKRHGLASAPATGPTMTTMLSSTAWPKPGGRWVDITSVSGVKAALRAGTMRGIGVGPAGTQNLLYYGRFNRDGAKIEVTYKR